MTTTLDSISRSTFRDVLDNVESDDQIECVAILSKSCDLAEVGDMMHNGECDRVGDLIDSGKMTPLRKNDEDLETYFHLGQHVYGLWVAPIYLVQAAK